MGIGYFYQERNTPAVIIIRTKPYYPILQKIIIICGPTGVGKTGFAIELARQLGGQIVGADSMQIYRFMDIGTAKPTDAERAAVAHHMVDIVDPDQHFDAAAFGTQAHQVVQSLIQHNIVPLVVGGTGLYIKALLYGLFKSRPVEKNVRRQLQQQIEQEGPAALHARLARHDPQTAARLHPNDTYRIIRALEVLLQTGEPISRHHHSHGFQQPRYLALKIGLNLPREQLYARIDARVEQMLAAGLEKEVRRLLQKGYGPDLKTMQSLGYRHMIDYLQGRLSREEAVRTLKRDHRRYAKRQLTWFKADDSVQWLLPSQLSMATQLADAFLNEPPADL